MELSISLSEQDVELLDEYAHERGLGSRSAVVQHAIRMLRNVGLEPEYAAARDEWESSGARVAWECVVGDGPADAPRRDQAAPPRSSVRQRGGQVPDQS
jgi:hypothetical protein